MVEFEIDGRKFRFDKLPAMQQFHVSRKIAPLMPPLMPIFVQVVKEMGEERAKAKGKGKDATAIDSLGKLAPLLQPFADALAGMNDETAEYVFNVCLGVIRYKHGENWIQFWNTQGKVAMVAELNDVGLMLRLVARVIQDSLAPFIAGFLTSAGEPEEETARSEVSLEAKIG